MSEKLGISQQCVLAAQVPSHILGCIKISVASRSREVILPLYFALFRPHLDDCSQLWHFQHKNMNLMEWFQERVTKVIRGRENPNNAMILEASLSIVIH